MSKASKALLEESKKRRSYRKFLPEKIDMEIINDCIMTAATGPNGADKQPWHFCVVTSDQKKAEIRKASEAIEKTFYEEKISDEWRKDLKKLDVDHSKPFLTEAPCLITIFKEFYSLDEAGNKDMNYYVNESVGIAIGLLINALRNAGYTSLTYTPAPMMFLRDILGRPEGETPVMVLVVGKADPSFELPILKKKPLDEIASYF